MTIRTRIVGGLTIVSIISLIFGIVGLVSTRMLTGLANELYILQEADKGVADVLNAHYKWRQGLTEAVLSETEFTGSLDPHTCALGKWRDSEAAQRITDTEILSLLSQVDKPHAKIHTEAKTIVAMMQEGDSEGAKRELLDTILPKTQEVITTLTNMEARYSALADAKSAEIINLGNRITVTIIALLSMAVVLVVFFNWRITESVMQPIKKMTTAAEVIATGDLDVQVSYNINDEIGMLAKAFQNIVKSTKAQAAAVEALAAGDLTVKIEAKSDKDVMNQSLTKMIQSLNTMFSEIKESSAQVYIGSKQIADGAQTLAQGSAEQAAAVEQLSSSINHITGKTDETARTAREAAELSGVIKTSAEKGNAQMEQMMQAVREINDASGQIGKVIKVIDDIAFQTNILALNAAVEAARAGSSGKGFAVVAEEVRSLAAKSAEAANNTGGLIENTIAKANLGLEIATETSASLIEIVDGINRSADIVANIARTSDEQATAIKQINTGIEQVAQVVQQNSATAEESAAASEEMNGQAVALEQLVSQFKLDSSDNRPPVSAKNIALP